MVLQCLEKDTFKICRDSHGTRSIQKLIEVVKLPIHFEIIRHHLKTCMVDLCYDINGNHVIQKILKTWRPLDNQFIYDAMNEQCATIACHKHGCCIMQKCIDSATENQMHQLTHAIASNTLAFVMDPFANYVVQYILKLKIDGVNAMISQKLLSQYVHFSKQKFSSNVIEKCLEYNAEATNDEIVRTIMIGHPESIYSLISH